MSDGPASLDELRARFARLLDACGEESPTVGAFARWHQRDKNARQVMAEVRLLKAIFGTAAPPKQALNDVLSDAKGGPRAD